MTTPPVAGPEDGWVRLAPAIFVVLWSTGFIGAKFGLPYAEPLTFLFVRLAFVATVLTLVALVMRARWPATRAEAGHIAVAGLLVHGIYLGGVFMAIKAGLPAGVTSLVVGLQPLLTAAAAGPVFGERVAPRQWLGLALGLVGVALVVSGKLLPGASLAGLPLAVFALAGITAGTLYQKRYCVGMDLRSGTAIQYIATSTVLLVLAWSTETMRIEWTGEFVFALVWLSLVLSVGAIFLLFLLIRRGAAAQVASLFYLVPPFTAAFAWALFDERLGVPALVGMVLTAVGVALVNRSAPRNR
ncbi:MAG TPA: DMT family transporter [Azospirillaceae bacterium]|nr:DMT family transporter [Azospirillaceae bacterium]